MTVTRRDFIKTLGLGAAAAGAVGVAGSSAQVGSAAPAAAPVCTAGGVCYPDGAYTWFNDTLTDVYCPGTPGHPSEELAANEMRIIFLGTSCIPRLSQQGVGVYIEVGPTVNGRPLDYALFDCGMGVLANALAAGIAYSRMDKIFIAHLHADHMSELSAIYCFGEANDRKSPLYIWGPGPSGVPDPYTGYIYDDGLNGVMGHFRELWRWHTESFSFGQNSYHSYVQPTKESWGLPVDPVPLGPKWMYNRQYVPGIIAGAPSNAAAGEPQHDGAHHAASTPVPPGDAPNDSYAVVPIQLDWQNPGVAYNNPTTGLKISYFQAIHTRKGAISYKVEWTPPNQTGTPKTITMIYSGDTKPNRSMIREASNDNQGIDVLIHEIVMPPKQWAAHVGGIPASQVTDEQMNEAATIENSSHTTQGAFGYLMSQITPLPRLIVPTHFQAQDDTIDGDSTPTSMSPVGARTSIANHGIADGAYVFAADFMVLNVSTDKTVPVRVRKIVPSHYAFNGLFGTGHNDLNAPKYWMIDPDTGQKIGDANAQIDNTDWIPYTGYPGNPDITYDEYGY
jgi:ribonuclease Z